MLKSNAVTVIATTESAGGLTISVKQLPGQLPVWTITGLTPNETFSVLESPPGAVFGYTADAGGVDSRPFSPEGNSPGTPIILLVTDDTTGLSNSTTFTLQ